MKIKSTIVIFILAVLSFYACTQEEYLDGQQRILTVNVDQRGVTRAEVDSLNTTFTNNDAIGIYVVDEEGNILYDNAYCSLYDGVWYTDIYYNSNFSNYKFFAYYPYNYELDTSKLDLSASDATEFFSEYISEFEPQEDQSELEGYMASDLMTSLGTYNSDTGTVTFKMDHEMGLAIITVYDADGNQVTDLVQYDSADLFARQNPIPYKMTGAFFLIVHPDKPVGLNLNPTGAAYLETILKVSKGHYSTGYTDDNGQQVYYRYNLW